jgi:hypothetical protein
MKPAPQTLLPCLVMMAAAGCGSGKKPAAAAPPKVGTVTAEQQTVPLTRDLVGRLSAYFSANVVARVSGVLVKRARTKKAMRSRRASSCSRSTRAYYTAVLNNNLADPGRRSGDVHQQPGDRRARSQVAAHRLGIAADRG